MKKSAPFRFKQFEVSHSRSALKVGVDGTLLGAWTEIGDSDRVLDIGTGCGLIALMLAQRSCDAQITGIDIHLPSVEEAALNFASSPWSPRLRAVHKDFLRMDIGGEAADDATLYSLIVSNPPFFNAGIETADTPRMSARHQSALPLAKLVEISSSLLIEGGSLALILPSDKEAHIFSLMEKNGLHPYRTTMVKGHLKAPVKRMLIQAKKSALPVVNEVSMLVLEESPGIATEEYRNLTKDFYLKF